MFFSEKTLQILHAGGWAEDRLLSADSFIEKLTKAGYMPHAPALEVLQRFGGLEFSHTDSEGYIWNFHFNIDRTIAICDMDDIEDYGNCIGSILCPVGEFDNGHYLIAIAEDGRFFSYFNPFICLDGKNYVDAIERYCMQPGTTIKRLSYDGNPLKF